MDALNHADPLVAAMLAGVEELAELIPPDYADYRPLVGDGLVFFLQRLPSERLFAIASAQLALPEAAGLPERLVALFRECPTLHKLGQVVARDRRLAPELRERLQGLESLASHGPIDDILALLDSEIGAQASLAGVRIAPNALAEASVAVVVPFSWPKAPADLPRDGVFKVLRPGVTERLEQEFDAWTALGDFFEERCAHYGLPAFDYRNTLENVVQLLANEIHLDGEQAHLAEAAVRYADMPGVVVPRLLPFCTPRVTAMERLHGGKVTDADGSPEARCRRAESIIDALLARPFWNGSDAGAPFHADPHAGNLLATPDDRLGILDWALVTRLSKARCEAVVQLAVGALTLDGRRILRALEVLGEVRDGEGAQAAVGDLLARIRGGQFPGFDWMLALLDRLATTGAMRFPEDIALFRKALLTLQGVIADVSEAATIDRVLIGSGLAQFMGGFGLRMLHPPTSRGVGAHLSNADLMDLWMSMPATAMRYWFGGSPR